MSLPTLLVPPGWFLLLLLLLLLLLIIRIAVVVHNIYQARTTLKCLQQPHKLPLKTLVVLGSGGHTTELLDLVQQLNVTQYEVVYCKAITDTTSTQRIVDPRAIVYSVPRSREVGQSYVTSIGTTLYAQFFGLLLVANVRPQLLLCNGPGTCVPLCVAALGLRVLGLVDTRIIFCESLCRVRSLSVTGLLLYYAADLFVVHWKELHQQYPYTVRISSFVRDDE